MTFEAFKTALEELQAEFEQLDRAEAIINKLEELDGSVDYEARARREAERAELEERLTKLQKLAEDGEFEGSEDFQVHEANLYCPIPEPWDGEFLIKAYESFSDCMDMEIGEVDYEGFVNGFAWALTSFDAAFEEARKETEEMDLKA